MSVNTSIYGTSEQWFDYQTTNFDDEALKFKQAYIGNGGKRLQDGFGYGITLNEPIDKSLSWCGLGNFSTWSKISYYKTSEDMALIAQDNRTATNFSLNASNGSYTGVYIGDVGTYSGSDTMYYGSIQRWSPKAVNSYSSYTSNFNANVEPLTQIPLRNCVFVPYFRVAKQINSANDTTGMDVRNILAWDYYGTTATGNHTTHPYILAITMLPYHLENKNTSTRTSTGTWRFSSILDEISLQKGIPKDFDKPDQEIMDMVYCYNIFNQPNTINGWTIFGHTVNGAPVGGVSSSDIIGFTDATSGFGNSNSNRINTIKGVVVYNHPNEVFSPAFTVSQSSQGSVTVTTKGCFHYVEYYDNGDDDNLQEWVRKQIACFGLFFTDDKTTAETGDFNDPLMCLGILDDNNVGQGFYSMGEDNEDQKQWSWETTNDSDYDPTGGGGGSADPSYPDTNPILPSTPGFTLAGKGTQCYAITYLDMNEIMEDIFGTSSASYEELIEGLAMFGSNPMNAFISYKWYPFTFSSSSKSPIILGSTVVNDEHTYDILNGVDNTFKEFTASCSIQAENNFVNSRRSKAQLFLPFYGFYEVPMNLLMSQPISVSFRYNVPDAMGVWVISFGSKIYDFVECDPSIEVPLTGDNQREIMITKRQIAAQNAIKAAMVVALIATAGVQGVIGGEIASAAGTSAAAAGQGVGTAIAQGIGSGLANFLPTYGKQAAATIAGSYAVQNKITNLSRTLGNLSINVPSHGAADATTFLNLPLYPFIIVYTPKTIEDYNEAQYKLKVGIACDKWVTVAEMPQNSLLKAGGIANMDTSGMELTEIQELNGILQTGFYR